MSSSGIFWKCWDIVKVELMRANHHFGDLHGANLQWLNSVNIVLLPQKEGVEEIIDFMPISLIYSVAKIIAKILAIRLSMHMNSLVSNARSSQASLGIGSPP